MIRKWSQLECLKLTMKSMVTHQDGIELIKPTNANRSVYAIAFRPAGQTSRYKPSYSRWPGHPSCCHGFCQRDKFVTNSTILHRRIPAKTHAIATQGNCTYRRNVSGNC